MNVYIICSVRKANEKYRNNLEKYVRELEEEGHKVHLPHRDTDQNARGIDICKQNREATVWADEIHIFFSGDSTGSHFDLGMAFVLNKKILVVENEKYGEGKSFAKMIDEWEDYQLIDEQKLSNNKWV